MDRERMRDVIKQVSAMTPEQREALAAKCPILNTEGQQGRLQARSNQNKEEVENGLGTC